MRASPVREGLAGKVQMIYRDPPYGIEFASNFQPEIGRRDVKDNETDLTRKPETVKAYRDTWTLGVHSNLSYLRDRPTLCRELLADSGSIFVQISDENLHRVRCVMDEVFGSENCVVIVTLKKTAYHASTTLATVTDSLLWFAKYASKAKVHALYMDKTETVSFGLYRFVEESSGHCRALTEDEAEVQATLARQLRRFPLNSLISQGQLKQVDKWLNFRLNSSLRQRTATG